MSCECLRFNKCLWFKHGRLYVNLAVLSIYVLCLGRLISDNASMKVCQTSALTLLQALIPLTEFDAQTFLMRVSMKNSMLCHCHALLLFSPSILLNYHVALATMLPIFSMLLHPYQHYLPASANINHGFQTNYYYITILWSCMCFYLIICMLITIFITAIASYATTSARNLSMGLLLPRCFCLGQFLISCKRKMCVFVNFNRISI